MTTTATRKPAAKPAAKVAVKPVARPAAIAVAKKPVTAAAKKAPVASKPNVPASPAAADNKAHSATEAAKSKARPADKIKKAKLVRDSFTMPETEYAALSEVKKACLKAGFDVKKSELLRIGVALVRKLALAVLKQEVGALAPLKAGRPRKDKAAAES